MKNEVVFKEKVEVCRVLEEIFCDFCGTQYIREGKLRQESTSVYMEEIRHGAFVRDCSGCRADVCLDCLKSDYEEVEMGSASYSTGGWWCPNCAKGRLGPKPRGQRNSTSHMFRTPFRKKKMTPRQLTKNEIHELSNMLTAVQRGTEVKDAVSENVNVAFLRLKRILKEEP